MGIEWTDRTWNPVVGCSWISPGCNHCYAARFARRLTAMGRAHYAGTTAGGRWTGRIHAAPERIWAAPSRWRPSRIFVCSMSDFFHPGADPYRARATAAMTRLPEHTWQILTKRASRIGPLPGHIWMGVTVESDAQIERVAELRARAPQVAVRWLCLEPLLSRLTKLRAALDAPGAPIDWIVMGGESGPGARRCDIDWLREVRDIAIERDIAVWLKQLGGYPHKRGGAEALLDGRCWTEFPPHGD